MGWKEGEPNQGSLSLTSRERGLILRHCQEVVGGGQWGEEDREDWFWHELDLKKLFAEEVAKALLDKTKQITFSVSDLERMFDIPRHRQTYLVKIGVSPARMRGKNFFYSREGAKELLAALEFGRFYGIRSSILLLGLEKKNLVYWVVKKGAAYASLEPINKN